MKKLLLAAVAALAVSSPVLAGGFSSTLPDGAGGYTKFHFGDNGRTGFSSTLPDGGGGYTTFNPNRRGGFSSTLPDGAGGFTTFNYGN